MSQIPFCNNNTIQVHKHGFDQTPGDSEGQGSLACCSSRGRKVLGTT